MSKSGRTAAIGLVALAGIIARSAAAADAWTSRSGDLQNTASAGMQPGLRPENVHDLQVVRVWQPEDAGGAKDGATINATPILVEGLLVTGDWMGRVYVIDTARRSADPQDDILLKIATGARGNLEGRGTIGNEALDKHTAVGHLEQEFGNYVGMQSTPAVGRVTTPALEELRAYVPVIARSKDVGGLYCINLSRVLRDRGILNRASAAEYLCDQPDVDGDGNPEAVWPRSIAPPGSLQTVMNASPKLSVDQPFDVNGDGQVGPGEALDVLYIPSAGLDCSDGRMWAMNAYTGEILWDFDPVPGTGGSIWTTPALSRDRSKVFITTGDCVGKPQTGAKAEALVALDATGVVPTDPPLWFHQRRLVDTADLDIGTGPVVADVDGYGGCNVVVSSDKDGCVYAFDQQIDIPDIGDPGWDPLRMGQQRVLWRKCFVPGTLNGGFNASNGALWGRTFMQQATGYPGGHNGADDSNAFGIDACTGKVLWASSDVSNGRTDAAVASEMLFQIGSYRLTGDRIPYRFVREVDVVAVDPGLGRVPKLLATVRLPSQPTLGGGGVAIADGRLYVPMVGGVAEVAVIPGSNASPPKKEGLNIFAGPYPEPIAPGADSSPPVVNPDDPYPLMLENPNPTAVVESIQGYLATLQEEYP